MSKFQGPKSMDLGHASSDCQTLTKVNEMPHGEKGTMAPLCLFPSPLIYEALRLMSHLRTVCHAFFMFPSNPAIVLSLRHHRHVAPCIRYLSLLLMHLMLQYALQMGARCCTKDIKANAEKVCDEMDRSTQECE